MNNNARRVALLGGIAYLATFIFSMPAVGLLDPVTDHADFVLGGGGNDNQVLLGGVFELDHRLRLRRHGPRALPSHPPGQQDRRARVRLLPHRRGRR